MCELAELMQHTGKGELEQSWDHLISAVAGAIVAIGGFNGGSFSLRLSFVYGSGAWLRHHQRTILGGYLQ